MRPQTAERKRRQAGYSLVELLTVVTVFAVLVGSGLPHFDSRRQDINNVVSQVTGDLRFARARSITSGHHYGVKLLDGGSYEVERLYEDTSSAVSQWLLQEVAKTVEVPSHIELSLSDDQVDIMEFNTRGMMISADSFLTLTVTDTLQGVSHHLFVWPSGQIYYEN